MADSPGSSLRQKIDYECINSRAATPVSSRDGAAYDWRPRRTRSEYDRS